MKLIRSCLRSLASGVDVPLLAVAGYPLSFLEGLKLQKIPADDPSRFSQVVLSNPDMLQKIEQGFTDLNVQEQMNTLMQTYPAYASEIEKRFTRASVQISAGVLQHWLTQTTTVDNPEEPVFRHEWLQVELENPFVRDGPRIRVLYFQYRYRTLDGTMRPVYTLPDLSKVATLSAVDAAEQQNGGRLNGPGAVPESSLMQLPWPRLTNPPPTCERVCTEKTDWNSPENVITVQPCAGRSFQIKCQDDGLYTARIVGGGGPPGSTNDTRFSNADLATVITYCYVSDLLDGDWTWDGQRLVKLVNTSQQFSAR